MESNLFLTVIASLGSSGIVGTLFLWFVKSNFGNVVSIAVINQRMDRMDSDLADAKKEALEIKTNYNRKFSEQREHVSKEVDRMIDALELLRKDIAKIQTRCVAFHPELVE